MALPVSTMSPMSLTSFYDPYDGSVLSAKLFFYHVGTLDPFTVFTDSYLGVPHAQPVLTGGSGRVPPVWIGIIGDTPETNRYRVRVFDQYDTLLEDIDNLPGAVAPVEEDGGEPIEIPTNQLLRTGHIWCEFAMGNAAAPAGAVRCNGQTIGPPGSGATERQNADTHDLFIRLWQQDALLTADMLLPVRTAGGTASKGSSSQGDWDDLKNIQLPDLRGRVPVGTDPMGNAETSGRMVGAKFMKEGAVVTTGHGSDASVPGAGGGAANITLSIEQMPVHNHLLHDPEHTHVVNDPPHDHGIYDPTHFHPYTGFGTADPKWIQGGASSGRYPLAMNTSPVLTGVLTYGKATGVTLVKGTTGVYIDHAGGKGAEAATIPSAFTTQPFSLHDPFFTVTWYIKL